MRLSETGIDVLAVDRDDIGLASLAAPIRTKVADLSEKAGRDAIVAEATRCRWLVNAAGVMRIKPIESIELEDLQALIDINVIATWELTRRIGRLMIPGSAIVNVSSAAAKSPLSSDIGAYALTKAAILSLTRSFSSAYASRGIRVNAVCPGIIDTPMQDRVVQETSALNGLSAEVVRSERLSHIPMRRIGTAHECAAVIAFLLSSESSYMTGQAINVTGGWVTW